MKKIVLITLILMSIGPTDADARSKSGARKKPGIAKANSAGKACHACNSKRSLQTRPGFYIKAEVGGSFRNSKFKNSSVGNGEVTTYTAGRVRSARVWGAEVGYRFNERFRMEANVQYSNTRYRGGTSQNIYGDGTRNQKIKTIAAFLNGSLDFTKQSILTPYVTAGVGLTYNTGNLTNLRPPIPTHFTAKSGNTSFAWNVGGGIRMKVCKKIDLDLSYKYVDLGKVVTKPTITTDFPSAVVDSSSQKLRSNQITLGIIYNLN